VSDAILFIRADNLQIMEANPAALELYGYSLDELRSMCMLDLSVEQEETRKQIARTIRVRKTTCSVRRHRRKDGALLTVEFSGTAFAWHDQALVLGVVRDYSKRLEAEAAVQRHAEQLERALMSTVMAISSMSELRDGHTASHEQRVGMLAEQIAIELGMAPQAAKGLRVIGLIHDIGKIATPADILVRPGRLSAQEYALVQQHARQGYEILKNIEFPWPVAQAVLQHHERADGSGYPDGLKGDAIIIEARIIAVADVVEAMSSHRPYRPALGIDQALAEIERNRGRLYDGTVVDACLRVFREKGFAFAK
jgi:PAS domain S-box-containing protein/putative nucleotidyltransferase with HDIG domain